jgi:polysaccharide chain length determinant protein (PEP-CTERM system associated)
VIPGKMYKPEDVVEAAWRRRWFIVGPFILIAVASVIIAAIQPDRYRSEALLQIVPQQVPQDYVRSAVTVPLDSRLQAILQQILSRTQLEHIVQEFNLYPEERKRMLMEDVIERMRSKHVLIGGVPNGRINSSAFRVGFEAGNPKTAMLVAERLASLFINANLQDRSVFADQTDQFLQNQLAETRRQLKEYETKLEEFRKLNPGRMPGELQNNQQALGNVQSQVQAVQESINRDRDRQLMLQRMIADAAAAPPAQTTAEAPMPVAKQLENERTRLRNMQMRLKPNHPDIGIQQRVIRDLEQKATAEAMQQPVSAPVSSAGATRVSELQAESDALDRRIGSKQEDEKRLLATMGMYRQRVESAPSTESKLTELMRDYTTLQGTYQSLLSKSQEAKVAANLERQQIGEQFKVLDSARIPQRPSTPNRPLLILIGSLLGLGCGVALAALLEYRDKSLRTDDDVIVALSLPVLARVPTMTTAAERRRQKRLRLMFASSGALGVAVCVAMIAWKFNTIADWIR